MLRGNFLPIMEILFRTFRLVQQSLVTYLLSRRVF